MEKKRIGILLTAKPVDGGAFQYSMTLLRALLDHAGSEYELTIAYTESDWQKYIPDEFSNAHRIRLQKRDLLVAKLARFRLLPLSILRKYLCKFSEVGYLYKSDCSFWFMPTQDVWTYLVTVPVVGVIHDLMHRYERRFPEVGSYYKYHRREWHYRRICKYSIALLADSTIGKKQISESYGVDQGRIYILPYIAPDYVRGTQHDSVATLPQLPQKYIFYPAQFWMHKNHERLIYAMASLEDAIPDLQLVLVGSKKNNYSAVQELVGKLQLTDRVHFLGYVPNEIVVSLYKKARAMIMPTFFGPTNIPPLEAFALECPCAVSNIYGMPEQVGDAALLFDPGSVAEIAAALKKLWLDDELCETLVKKGRQRSLEWDQGHFNVRLHEIVSCLLK